jgi:hypothetical protein
MHTNRSNNIFRTLAALLFAGTLAFLSGCGGGDDGTPVTIDVQPTSQAVESGASAIFAVDASGDALQYQWQVSTDGGVSYADIAGANAETYATPATTLADDGSLYRVVVGNTLEALTSDAATLSVTLPPEPGPVPAPGI